MQTWRLINTGINNGYFNMALDEAIAFAVREGRVPSTLRFYTWDPPCISIGYFQKHDTAPGRPIVRRITGGRAVFHGGDLSYSVVSGTHNTLFPKNISGTYFTIASALIAGLRHFGIHTDPIEGRKVKQGSNTRYHKTVLCFNTAIRHEITVNGKKLIGSSQRRWSDVFLQHGSILIDGSMTENGPNSISLQEAAASSCDTLAVMLQGHEILRQVHKNGLDGLVASLSHGFTETLGIQFITEDLSDYETELAEILINEKYSKL